VSWFHAVFDSTKIAHLIFYCSSDRDPDILLDPIIKLEKELGMQLFHSIYFTENNLAANDKKDPSCENFHFRHQSASPIAAGTFQKRWQKSAEKFRLMYPHRKIVCFSSIAEIHADLEKKSSSNGVTVCQVLACGSLHLIGNILEYLNIDII
jgi:folylpolyglutamate synthase/dihydropteroate synthase